MRIISTVVRYSRRRYRVGGVALDAIISHRWRRIVHRLGPPELDEAVDLPVGDVDHLAADRQARGQVQAVVEYAYARH